MHEQLRRFEGTIVAATRGGLVETMGDRFPRWSFSEALLYSVTVITTIGKFYMRFEMINKKHFIQSDLESKPLKQ